MYRIILIVLMSATLVNCGTSKNRNVSKDKSLAANEGAHNIAIIGSGAGPGVSSSAAFNLDIKRMGNVLKAPPFNFDVRMNGDKDPEELATIIADAASELTSDGTLLFFFSGHGNRGNIYKGDKAFSSADLNAAAAHGQYARFTAIIEACESGSFARGNMALKIQSNYQSQLVMTAAKASEESADDGTDSFFPHYMEEYLVELSKTSDATMGDLASKVFAAAKKANSGQSGDMSAIPETILKESVHQAGVVPGNGIFVALPSSDSSASAQFVFASVPTLGSGLVTVCAADAATCNGLSAGDSRMIGMDVVKTAGDRTILRSKTAVNIEQQSLQTVLLFSSPGASAPIRGQGIQFKKR